MSEGIRPQQPSIDKMPEVESLEKRAREYFDLRLRFAEAMSRTSGEPLAKCLHQYTDLRTRIFGSDPKDDADYARRMREWEAFTNDVEALGDHSARMDSLLQKFAVKPREENIDARRGPYWPFQYNYQEEDGEYLIRMHFGSLRIEEKPIEGPGPLNKKSFEASRAKLRAIFAEIKREHPDVQKVRGRSWLYNTDAYRRLYPAAYTEHRTPVKGRFTGGSRWGQFMTHDREVNTELRDRFFRNLEHLDPQHPEAAFPLPTLAVEAPISEFYKEYGIE